MTLLGDGSQGLRPLALRPGRPPSMAHAPTSCRAAQTWSFPGPEAHGGSWGRTYRDPPSPAPARQGPSCYSCRSTAVPSPQASPTTAVRTGRDGPHACATQRSVPGARL